MYLGPASLGLNPNSFLFFNKVSFWMIWILYASPFSARRSSGKYSDVKSGKYCMSGVTNLQSSKVHVLMSMDWISFLMLKSDISKFVSHSWADPLKWVYTNLKWVTLILQALSINDLKSIAVCSVPVISTSLPPSSFTFNFNYDDLMLTSIWDGKH